MIKRTATIFVLSFLITSLCQTSTLAADQIVELQTDKGPILMRIFYSIVPYTAGHFLDLVDQGFYNGLIFHRVENWCIQGGDPNGNGTGNYVDRNTGQTKFLKLEINRALNHNMAGTVAMARSQNPNSASCQFYILKAPMPQLNGNYAVFGRVINGMSTVMAIRPGDRILSARIAQSQNSNPPQTKETNTKSEGFEGSGKAPRTVEPGF